MTDRTAKHPVVEAVRHGKSEGETRWICASRFFVRFLRAPKTLPVAIFLLARHDDAFAARIAYIIYIVGSLRRVEIFASVF